MSEHQGLVRAEIDALPIYNAGSSFSQLKKIYGQGGFTKLDSNENPFGFSPTVTTAIGEAACEIFRYPDRDGDELRRLLAQRMGLSDGQIIFGDGSEQLIQVVYQTIVRRGDHIVMTCPGFGLYEIYGVMAGARVTKVNFSENWRFPVDAMLEALARGARILALCSPSNPVGVSLTEEDFERLLAGAPADTLIILDEAYYEFLPAEHRFDAIARLRDQSRPWLILRTFSKAYGLAALRIGYGIACSEDFAVAMNKVRTPFAVNGVAQAAALAALQDEEHLRQTLAKIVAERERVASALDRLGYGMAPSQANFLFVDMKRSAGDFAAEARQRGVFVKDWHEEPFTNYLRVTIGLAEENDRFLALFA